MGQLQSDEYFRAAQGRILELTGKSTADAARKMLVELKVGLNRIAEAQANLADAEYNLIAGNGTTDENHSARMNQILEIARRELENLQNHVVSLVPTNYQPFKSKIETVSSNLVLF
jgi:hypothetical protein